MILSTHAIVGGAVASLLPSHPALVAALSFASHFAIDAIPHWDYPLRALSVKEGAKKPISKKELVLDLALVGFDGCAGLAIALWLFASADIIEVIALGACAGMLPDPLQIAYRLYPREPLRSLQRFHHWMHTRQRLAWRLGVSSQALITVAVAGAALGLR